MSDIIKFDFQGDELDCVKEGETLWVSVRRVCEALGIDGKSQRDKLKNKSWSNGALITSLDASGRNFEQYFVDVDTVPMWLANIDEGRVSEHVRPKLIKYQKEAARALRDHFFKAMQTPETFAEALQLAADLETERVKEKEARLLAEAKIEADVPRVEFANAVKGSVNAVTVSEFAKYLSNGGIPFGEITLFKWLRRMKYLQSGGIHHNIPYQSYIDNGWLKLDPRVRWSNQKKGNEVYHVTLITGKGQTVFEKKIRDNPDTWKDILRSKLQVGKKARAENVACAETGIQ